jgi:hypothetical protein
MAVHSSAVTVGIVWLPALSGFARLRAGCPRLSHSLVVLQSKTLMAGTSPAITKFDPLKRPA